MYFRRTHLFPSPRAKPVNTDTQKPRLRVRFDEQRNEEYENTLWSKRDCPRRWYTKNAIKQMKEDAFTHARSQRFSKSMRDESFKKVILSVYDECCTAMDEKSSLSSLNEYSLKVFVAQSHSRTGLERTGIREIEQDKRRRRKDLLDAVFDAHETYKNGSHKARTELVRLASEPVTRPARVFARHLAMALATSLQR